MQRNATICEEDGANITIDSNNDSLEYALWYYNYSIVPSDFTGIVDGNYYTNGKIDTSYTGFATDEA